MNLTLTREPADGLSVRGVLSPLGMATLENAAYLIPCGTYPLTVTYSPRFKRPLPLVCDVPVLGSGPATLREYGVHPLPLVSEANDLDEGQPRLGCPSVRPAGAESAERIEPGCPQGGKGAFRSGIRFHPGTKPEHSRGCILVSRADEDRLRELIQEHGNVTLKIIISDNLR